MSTITWINTGSISQDQIKTTEIIINYLEGYINSHLARPINWDVSLNVDPSVSTANGTSNSVFLFKESTKNLWLFNGAYQSITGVEKSGFDAIININPKYLTDYFLDPTPETKNDLPSNKVDTLSTFLHEMVHGLSFNGWTSWSSYENSTNAVSAFDKYITTLNGKPYFNGENAKLAYGGLVPLSPGNVFHLGNDSDGRQLEFDLMQGFTSTKLGFRRTISDLDLAIFADCGIGTIRNDILAGSILADNIAAGTGNDTVRASVGDDIIDGGADLDSFSVPLARSQVIMSFSTGGNMTLSSTSFGSDTLMNIERIDFTDGDLVFDVTSANAPAAYRLYGGAFARTPDEGGFRFWASKLDEKATLRSVATEFINSGEFIGRYGSSLSNGAFVDALYQNVLSRGGDAGGVAYWSQQLDNKLQDRSDVLVQFTQLAEFVGISAANITNGYWVV